MLTEAVELLRFDQISYFVKGSNKKMYPSIRDALAEIANGEIKSIEARDTAI